MADPAPTLTPAQDELRGNWEPQKGPQDLLVRCPSPEVFFGGARGGGKTDGVLGKWGIKEREYGKQFNAMMFRPTRVSAEDAIERSKEIYGPMGGKFNEQRMRWRMPNGGRVGFGYLETVKDANEWQGRNLTDVWIEEAGLYPSPLPIDRMFGVLRSPHGVPVQMVLTGNPGGAGQHWLRERYRLHPFPSKGMMFRREVMPTKYHVVSVIPSRITDNKLLLANDPDYIQRLHLVGSPQLVKAWLEGDWSAIEGAFFDCWSEAQHVIAPFRIPPDWLRFRSMDWGSASPFSIGWWAVVQDDYDIGQGPAVSDNPRLGTSLRDIEKRPRTANRKRRRGVAGNSYLPRGAIVRYREDYGASAPGRGLKLSAEAVADRIISRERGEALGYGVLDPSAFREDGGPSIAERINRKLLDRKLAPFRPADNARVPRLGYKDRSGPMSGWDQVRGRLIGTAKYDNGIVDWTIGRPMMYVFSTCTELIRTLPTLQHDVNRAEDLDTKSEDHAADEARYAAMSRPWLRTPLEPEEKRDAYRPLEDDGKQSLKLL
jgi:hypothetical protein